MGRFIGALNVHLRRLGVLADWERGRTCEV